MLVSRFASKSNSIRRERALTTDEMFAVAPSIFADDKHESRSTKYTYIPTIKIIEGLIKEGFSPFMACQSRSRVEGKEEFTKHMLRLRKNGFILKDESPEIILINSHDGTSSYQMLGGMYRFVCMNGMVTGDTMQDIRIPHRGNIVHDVIEAAYTITEDFDKAIESMEIMKDIDLSLPEQQALATASLALKYDEEPPVTQRQILLPNRIEDKKSDLWHTFNRIQENLTKGGQRGITSLGKRTTTRGINGIDNNIKLNKALWVLSEEMAKIKGC